jgi:aryl-alcohol dehydrogenase-like predicted oxidoreductase
VGARRGGWVNLIDMPQPINPFALGAANWGTKVSGDAVDALYAAFRAAGGTRFDTAHVYACWLPNGTGASERALGDVVRRHGDRADVTIATKGGHPPIDGMYPRPGDYLSPRQIAADVRDSLDRLGDDAIDLYFLHRDDPRLSVGEIVDALHEQVAAGRIRQVGVSNWSTARIDEANAYAQANGRMEFTASQPKFSLGVPRPSKDPLVPDFGPAEIAWHATRLDVELWAYSSTANGHFATNGEKGKGFATESTARRLTRAKALAAELGATPNQVALAWMLAQPFPVVPILGTGDLDHLRDALGAARVTLSDAQARALSAD